MIANEVRLNTNKSNGREYWVAAWTIGMKDGKRIERRKSIGAKSKYSRREALAACHDLARKHIINPASAKAGKGPTLEAWCNRFVGLRTEIDEGTKSLDADTIRMLKLHFGGGTRIDHITPLQAADFRAWLAKQPGRRTETITDESGEKIIRHLPLAEASVCRHIRTTKLIFAKALKYEQTSANPFAEENGTPAEVEHNWRDLDDKTIATLIEKSPSDDWRRMLALCAYAGLRRGEALRLKWENVSLEKRRLTVRTKSGKTTTKQKVREVLIVPELETILAATPEADRYGTVAAISINNIDRDIVAVIRAAGLQPWSKPFHTLRKWRATSWRLQHPEAYVDSWLGHSLAVAREHYVKVPESAYGTQRTSMHQVAALLASLSEAERNAIMAQQMTQSQAGQQLASAG